MPDPERQVALLARCRAVLAACAARRRCADGLRYFTTIDRQCRIRDAVREALGAERINLTGASGGTRAALEYQRQFPGAVRSGVLDGVAPARHGCCRPAFRPMRRLRSTPFS